MVVVHAFELHVVREPRLPIDARGKRILRIEKFGVRAEGAHRAGHQIQQALEVAIVGERQVSQLARFNLAAGV